MARWGNCDYKQLQKLRENLERLQSADLDKFCLDVSKELAARLLALVIPRTPVGNYKVEVEVTAKRDSKRHKKGDVYTKRINPTGKMGGTLRRGWTARTEQDAASGSGAGDAKAYAQSLPNRAAISRWRSSTRSTMPAMWSLATGKRWGAMSRLSARRSSRAGSKASISSPCRSRT